ncbi:MAG: hypothetical protein EKK55_08830 [Rhodocyclaceae bacterium]|nr:MAG: hypothetical protein EKK55_08830 [Rhodocyclaceae bacterium]
MSRHAKKVEVLASQIYHCIGVMAERRSYSFSRFFGEAGRLLDRHDHHQAATRATWGDPVALWELRQVLRSLRRRRR